MSPEMRKCCSLYWLGAILLFRVLSSILAGRAAAIGRQRTGAPGRPGSENGGYIQGTWLRRWDTRRHVVHSNFMRWSCTFFSLFFFLPHAIAMKIIKITAPTRIG